MTASTTRRPFPTFTAHAAGIVLVVASAFVFSASGVLTKAIDADLWTIACWRGLVGGVLIAAYVAAVRRNTPLGAAFRLGWRGWVLAIVSSAGSLAFILAFKMTHVAHVAVIYATAPFMAAALGWWLMRERAGPGTLPAAGVSMAGVAVVVWGGAGAGVAAGDAVAIVMTALNALIMVLVRRFASTPVIWAQSMSAFLIFAAAWGFVDPFAVSARDFGLIFAFGLCFGTANILWIEGTKRIPAAESGLLGTAETPFAVMLAWLVLSDLPPVQGFVGGAVVMAAVVWHATRGLMRERKRRAAPR